MKRLSSPGWSSGIPSGPARDCLQRNWQFSPEYSWCSSLEESIDHTFPCLVMQLLCKLLEGFKFRILSGKFFVQLWYHIAAHRTGFQDRQEHYVSAYLALCML